MTCFKHNAATKITYKKNPTKTCNAKREYKNERCHKMPLNIKKTNKKPCETNKHNSDHVFVTVIFRRVQFCWGDSRGEVGSLQVLLEFAFLLLVAFVAGPSVPVGKREWGICFIKTDNPSRQITPKNEKIECLHLPATVRTSPQTFCPSPLWCIVPPPLCFVQLYVPLQLFHGWHFSSFHTFIILKRQRCNHH